MAEPAWAAHLPAGVRARNVDLCPAPCLTAAWRRHWEAAPDRPVLHDRATGWLSGGALDERSRRVAGRLAGAGLRAGDRIAVSAAGSVDLAVALVGALRLGLVLVPTNPAYREREVARIVGDARPAAALVDDPTRAGWIRRATPGDPVLVGPGVELPDAPPGELDAGRAEDPALLAYTSGTTGAPKGAVLRHRNLLASGEAVRIAWRWGPEDRLLLTLPLFHLHGLGVGLFGSLGAGGSLLLRGGFDVDDVLDAAPREGATLFFGVPTMYARLARSPRVARLRSLRLCVSGSAPLPPDLWHELARSTGHRVLERYGMTETAMNVSNPHDGERRPGTVGLPLPGVELRLSRPDGQVLLRGPNVFDGYWERPAETAAAFDDQGWFATGDLGELDEAGYLRLVGRAKELIITGGYNVHPREVEDVLRRDPAVRDVAVVGRPSETWGEEVTAVIEAEGELDEHRLASLAERELAPHKRPRSYERRDALPRNAMGKLQRHELRGS